MRDVVFEYLDAIADERYAVANKIGRQLRGMGPPMQYDVYARQWIKRNPEHERVAKWIERKAAERAEANAPRWLPPGKPWRLNYGR